MAVDQKAQCSSQSMQSSSSSSKKREEETSPRCPQVSFLQEELKDGRGVERNIPSTWTGMRLGIGVLAVKLAVSPDRISGSGERRIYLGALLYASLIRSIHYCDYPYIWREHTNNQLEYKVNHGSTKATWLNLSITGETNPGVIENATFTQSQIKCKVKHLI